MTDLMTFLDFAVDIVCMMPPLDEIDAITITRDQAILVSLGAIGLLIVAITISALKEAFPENTAVAIVVATCVVGIGFIGIKQEMLKGLFLAFYPPMVIVFRFAEGAIIGCKTSRHLRWWHSILCVVVIIGLYYLIKPLPIENLAFVKGGWALFGAGLAAFIWTRMMADSSVFQSPFSIISIFLVFASTLVYVSVSPLEHSFYQWTLPIGLVVGIIYGRVLPHNAEPPPSDRESVTKGA